MITALVRALAAFAMSFVIVAAPEHAIASFWDDAYWFVMAVEPPWLRTLFLQGCLGAVHAVIATAFVMVWGIWRRGPVFGPVVILLGMHWALMAWLFGIMPNPWPILFTLVPASLVSRKIHGHTGWYRDSCVVIRSGHSESK